MLHTYYHGVLVAIDAASNARYHVWMATIGVVCYVGCYSVNSDHRSFVM